MKVICIKTWKAGEGRYHYIKGDEYHASLSNRILYDAYDNRISKKDEYAIYDECDMLFYFQYERVDGLHSFDDYFLTKEEYIKKERDNKINNILNEI